jgi:hypothetical protein
MPAVGALVRCANGAWMVRPPLRCPRVQHGMDVEERQALKTEGLDPDDPAVIARR